MKHVTLCITSLLCAAVLTAQDDKARTQQYGSTDHKGYHVSLSEVLGAKVRLKPEVRGTTPMDPKNTDPRSGEVRTTERTAKSNGSIEDLLVDCNSGQSNWAIVSVGGLLGIGDKLVAVPASALSSTARAHGDDVVFDLAATEAELKSLPAFDKSVMEKSGLDVVLRNAETSWKRVRPDAMGTPNDASGTRNPIDGTKDTKDKDKDLNRADRDLRDPEKKFDHNVAAAILATQIKGMPVRASDTKDGKSFGNVESAGVDVNTCRVSYLIVERGGVLGIGESKYLIPLRATSIQLDGDKDDNKAKIKPVAVVQKTTAEMESAPKYTKPEKGFLNEEAARTSCEFYGVDKDKSKVRDIPKDRP